MATSFSQGVSNLASGGVRLLSDLWNGQAPSTYRTTDSKRVAGEYATAMAMLFGRQVDVLKEDLRQSCPDDFAELMYQPMTFNLVRRVAEKRATLYREPAEFSGDVGEWVDLLVWGFWAAMGQADLISEVCGQCPLLVEWDAKRKAIVPFVLPPDSVQLKFDRVDPSRLLAATVFSATEDERGNAATMRTVYTETEKRVFIGDSNVDVSPKLAEEGGYDYRGPEHGVGRVPVVLVRPQMPLHGEPLGHYDESLVQANRTINQKATELQLLLKLQANSNLVVNGDLARTGGKVSTGVSRFLHFNTAIEGAQQSAQWISPSPQAEALLKTIMDTVRMVAFFHHLPGNFSLDATAAESGTALKIRNSDLSEYRRSKIEAHSLMWPDLADLLERVRVVGQGGTHKPQDNIRVEICDQEVYESEEDVRAQLEWEIKNFLTSPAAAFLEMHPEFAADEEEDKRLLLAQAEVDKNAAAFKAMNGRNASVAPPVDFLKPQA